VPLGPVAALAVDPSVAGQKLPQAMAPAQEILRDVLPAPEIMWDVVDSVE
jgi:hypothetical protein